MNGYKINIMKAKLFYPLIILSVPILMSNGGGGGAVEQEYVSFPMINSEIRNSMEEHEVQKKLKTEQTINLGEERANRTLWEKAKETNKKIQERLRIVDFAIQSIPTGYAMSLEAQEIKETQEKIFRELNNAPYTLVVALSDQIKFVDDLQMTIRLLVGIVVSYGAINQMEKAERQELLKYALEEVKTIKYNAKKTLFDIVEAKRVVKRKKGIFRYYVDKDKRIIKDIIKNIKKL